MQKISDFDLEQTKKLSKFQKCKKTTDLPDLKSWRKRSFRLAVQKSNQVQIPGLRFYVLTVMMCFNSPLTDFYHTSTTRIEPLNHLWEYFLAECQKLEILFSIFTDFLKVISKLSKGLLLVRTGLYRLKMLWILFYVHKNQI